MLTHGIWLLKQSVKVKKTQQSEEFGNKRVCTKVYSSSDYKRGCVYKIRPCVVNVNIKSDHPK